MPKRRAPKPVRLGGKRAEDSLLFVALRSIADNLGNILRLALVLGILAIVDPLLTKIDHYGGGDIHLDQPGIEIPTEQTPDQPSIDELSNDAELQAIRESYERLQFASNCTRIEFQKTHYDECFPDGSTVYPRPTADEDDGSLLLFLESDTLYATR